MITAGSILTNIMNSINETSRDKHGAIILAAISRAYKMDVVNEHWWTETMRLFKPTNTVSSSTNQPIVLPAEFIRMRSVHDANYTYYEDSTRGKSPVRPYNWYHDEPVKTPLQEGSGANAEKDSAVVDLSDSGLVVDASAAGEWIHIGQSDDVYQILTRDSDTQVTLTRNFRTVEAARNVAWQIRPVGCKRIVLCDQAGTILSATDLVCEYQCSPMSVISEQDILELPDAAANAVLNKALMYSMQRKGWARAASALESEYRHALALAKRACPASRETMVPKRLFKRPNSSSFGFKESWVQ